MNDKRRIHVLKATLVAILLFLGTVRAQEFTEPDEADAKIIASLQQRLKTLSDQVWSQQTSKISLGSIATLKAYVGDIERHGPDEIPYMRRMTGVVEEILQAAQKGEDALATRKGFFWRGYESRYTPNSQLYSIYVPRKYKPGKPIPLVVSLHGGSSNHNVWLAMNLGNDIKVEDYWNSFRTEFKPLTHPNDAIVVAPDGLGQIRWRWQGEQDVFDVIEDVQKNYNIDPNKIFLTGLSNGGIGTYTAGLKHAWKFAAVLPMAGVTDWIQHTGAGSAYRPAERVLLENESAIIYAENAFNTHFRFFHGVRDPGFKVIQAQSMAAKLEGMGVPFVYHEIPNLGHDLTHIMWRKFLIMKFVRKYTRNDSPREVRLATASERANRQFWVVLKDRANHQKPARIRANVSKRTAISVETENVRRFTLLLDECPIFSPIQVTVDGQDVYKGPIPINNRLEVANTTADEESKGPAWKRLKGRMAQAEPKPGTRKTAGLSGPLGDAHYERQLHVYGTQVKSDTPMLRRAAELGGRNWVMARQYTEVRYPVIPDTEFNAELLDGRTLVLYGDAENNSVLAAIGDKLPIQIGKGSFSARNKKYAEPGHGVRFVCPNPLSPRHYLIVQAGATAEAVEMGGQLPIYLPDYIIYDQNTTKRKGFMVLGRSREVEAGFFTEQWKLPPKPEKK